MFVPSEMKEKSYGVILSKHVTAGPIVWPRRASLGNDIDLHVWLLSYAYYERSISDICLSNLRIVIERGLIVQFSDLYRSKPSKNRKNRNNSILYCLCDTLIGY